MLKGNPCHTCIVKATCTKDCKKLKRFMKTIEPMPYILWVTLHEERSSIDTITIDFFKKIKTSEN